MNSSRGGMTQLRSEIQPAGVSELQANRGFTRYFPVGNTRCASQNTYVPYQIVGNHETTAKVHGEHKGVCFPGVG